MSEDLQNRKARVPLVGSRRGLACLFFGAAAILSLSFAGVREDAAIPAEAKPAPDIVEQAYRDLQHGRFDQALGIFDQVLAGDAENLEALLGRALIFAERQEHEAAFDSYDAIVRRFPDHAFAWNGRGLAAFNLEDFDEALASFQHATADQPVNGFFYESIAWTRMCRGEFPEAAESAKTASLMYNREGEASLYPLLIAYFSYLEMGDAANAERTLTYAKRNIRSRDWPLPVLQYVSGAVSKEELISNVTSTAEETEAHTYIGLVLRLHGETAAAAKHLAWVRDRGDPRVFEHTLARSIDLASGMASLGPAVAP